MRFGDGQGQTEAQSEARLGATGITAVEALKNLGQVLLRNSDTGIPNEYPNERLSIFDPNSNRPA